MSARHYAAALMQAYLGRASMSWIAEQTGITVNDLREWRRQPEFLLVMDWSKAVFARAAEEVLILNDFQIPQYHDIAAELSLLEDSLRVTFRVPVYYRFRKTGQRLISRHQNKIPLETYDLRIFKRLFLFFLALEFHWPSPAGKRIQEDFLPFAREVVWPLLDQRFWVEPALQAVQETVPLTQIRLVLATELQRAFRRLIDQ